MPVRRLSQEGERPYFANQARTAAGLNQSSKLSLAMIVLLVDLDSGVSLLDRAFSQPQLSSHYQISGSMTIPKTGTSDFYDKEAKSSSSDSH
jgi:hypothetical protein